MRNKAALIGTFVALALTLCMSPRGNAAPQARLHSFILPRPMAQTEKPVQEFQGVIEKVGAKYVLEDRASGARYKLDKEDKARQFDGQHVKITGTLDPGTNVIRISEIRPDRGHRP